MYSLLKLYLNKIFQCINSIQDRSLFIVRKTIDTHHFSLLAPVAQCQVNESQMMYFGTSGFWNMQKQFDAIESKVRVYRGKLNFALNTEMHKARQPTRLDHLRKKSDEIEVSARKVKAKMLQSIWLHNYIARLSEDKEALRDDIEAIEERIVQVKEEPKIECGCFIY